VFISEIHYDNDGTDAGEAIEVQAPVGTDLSGWTLVLYRDVGTVYDTDPVGAPDANGIVVVTYPPDGIQNGSADGVALVDGDGALVELLSYEGTLTATEGPAVGTTSTDIGVDETSSTPEGQSLQRDPDDHATWTGPIEHTFGAVNAGGSEPPTGPSVFVNEIHYDNEGTDAGELVEVAGPAGTDLTGWTVVPYNGNGGATYSPQGALAGTPGDDTGSGFGFQSVTISGLQNGSPDGIALVDAEGDLVQFLSYEGSFTGVGGPADGVTSTDIGVAEAGSSPLGFSLQLTGTGERYGDFTWAAPAEQTSGEVNNDQVFAASGDPRQPGIDCQETVEVTTGTGATSEVSATDEDSGIASLAITSAPVDGITLDDSTAPVEMGEIATATLTVDGSTEVGTYDVEITATTDDDQQATCVASVVVSEPLETTLISTVQGSGAASPFDGQDVQVEAVVTSLITGNDVLEGFYIQEEDADTDVNAETSEGIYIFCGSNCPAELAAGDLVRVTGTVDEFFENTQINSTGGSVAVLESGLPLPAAAVVTLPAETSTQDPATFENVEGMRTTISTTLVVSEYFELARFGEVVLTADERSYQYTQTNEPSVEGYEAFLADLATKRIILDDDSNDQNDATSGPLNNEPYYYPTPGLSTGNYFRGGDTITDLTGVFEYSFGAWKLRPITGEDYTFEPTNPRPASPEEVGGRLKVASFNVLNYFATIDETSSDSTGPCGPSGNQDCRGADSETERQRQLAKIVAALEVIDADVFGLIEIQNDAGLATQQIVEALNAATAPGTYDYIETGFIGTDAIKQAFLYKTATVTPVGEYELLTSEDDPRFDDTRNRPALIQTFEEAATGERVTIAVNHLKSKGSGCGAGDDSPEDGSGNCDGTRTEAAQALADFLATDPTGSGDPDFLIIGDLNSYSQERPITTLEAAGYVDLLERFEGLESYGYVFDGLLGHLDHALATSTLNEQVTGAGGWKINADEVPLFDYNDDVRDVGEADFERESNALPLYEPNPYRSSDHDPVIVGLDLGGAVEPPPTTCFGFEPTIVGDEGGGVIFGTNGDDVILAGGGNDYIFALNGDDVVCAGDGNNVVFAGSGDDRVSAGDGNDIIFGGAGDDQLDGGGGHDLVLDFLGRNTIA